MPIVCEVWCCAVEAARVREKKIARILGQ